MNQPSSIIRALLVAVLSFQLASCGTLLYPERRGEKTGRLDVGVVLLDAVGLLFFLIPGIIAFAVDFSSGAIYLPATPDRSLRSSSIKNGYRVVRFDPKTTTPKMLEDLIRKETGKDFHFADQRLKTVELKDRAQIPVYFAQYDSASASQLTLLNR